MGSFILTTWSNTEGRGVGGGVFCSKALDWCHQGSILWEIPWYNVMNGATTNGLSSFLSRLSMMARDLETFN